MTDVSEARTSGVPDPLSRSLVMMYRSTEEKSVDGHEYSSKNEGALPTEN